MQKSTKKTSKKVQSELIFGRLLEKEEMHKVSGGHMACCEDGRHDDRKWMF